MTTKTYFTFMMVATLVATLEFNTDKKTNIITLVGLSWTNTNQTNISKDHDKGNDISKEVDEVAQVVEEVYVIGDDESSTDENFDMGEHAIQHDEPEEGS